MIELKNSEDKYLLSTVRIETDTGTGSGFICTLSNKDFGTLNKVYVLVTNKHVIQDAKLLKLKMHTIGSHVEKTKNKTALISLDSHDEIVIKDDLNQLFFFHPDKNIDIAILNLNTNVFKKMMPFVMPIEIDNIIPSSEDSYINLYDDVIFIGYPNGLYDEKHLLPIIRKGSFATPFQIDFNGLPIFLIDASVFPGSSGSPVFLFHRLDDYHDGKKISLIKPRIYFLGIISAVYTKNELFDLVEVKDIKAFGKQMIDIGIVYKSIEIRKLIKYYFISAILGKIINNDFPIQLMNDEKTMDDLIIAMASQQQPVFKA